MAHGTALPLELRNLQARDYAMLLGWFDPQAAAFLEPPDEQWLRYVLGSPQAHALLASHLGVDVVHLQVDVDESGLGSLAVITAPEWRGKGMAMAAVRLLIQGWCQAHGFPFLVGYVDPKNTAAQRFCERAGFQRLSDQPAADGLLEYRLQIPDRT